MPKTTPINGAWPAEQVRAAALVEERAIVLRLALIACFLLVVVPAAGAQTTIGTTRTYYIAADEVQWNYLPGGLDGMMGMKPAGHAKIYARHDAQTIGTVYRKAVYRAYTDATFTHLVPRSGANAYLGVLGPVLHAEVGDTIKVVFRNHASRPYSMHPHGVFYDKASEGAAYADGVDATAKNGDAVAPGKTFSYVWQVPERAGPGPNDPSSIAWFYHSHVDERRDIDAGLIGAIVVTRAGMARPDGTPKDVDHEFVALFMMFDENQSPYRCQHQTVRGEAEETPQVRRRNASRSERQLRSGVRQRLRFGQHSLDGQRLSICHDADADDEDRRPRALVCDDDR
jgi:FtsP/CotA-like multicopper oxidase with cupredoxin domain